MHGKQDMIDTTNLLHFWVFGDLHYRDHEQWLAHHSPRMKQMLEDVHAVWHEEGLPAFCVSPGDIVDRGAPANYELAKRDLMTHSGHIPFYPGIGNHEFLPENKNDVLHTAEEFTATWGKPVRYAWTAGVDEEFICIMLDQPDPFFPGTRIGNPDVIFSQESLAFLDTTLAAHKERTAIIFAHCPLHNTVLDRDPQQNLDDDSLDTFFFVKNSQEVRTILACHRNAALYISGHTHSGWGSPQLIFTETLGGHPVTHVNVMSPWYTGRLAGPRRNADRTTLEYYADDPDVQVTFALYVSRSKAIIRARDHRSHQWLAQWEVPIE